MSRTFVRRDGSVSTPLAHLARHADLARSRRALNERYLEQLRQTVRAPLTELPLLFVPRLGPEHVQQLSQTLERSTGS